MFRKISKFAVSPVGSGGALTMNATIEAGSNAEWWQQLPWESIALWFFIFWVGTIWADLMSEESDIKEWLKDKFKKFEVVSFTPSSHPSHKKSENTVTPRVKIKFKRNVKSNIRLNVQSLYPIVGYNDVFTAEILAEENYKKGDEKTFELATIYKEGHRNPFWNCKDGKGENHQFLKHTQHIATIIVDNQKHRFYIKHFQQNSCEQGICFILDEERNIWKNGNIGQQLFI